MPIALFTAPHHVCPGTCTYFVNNSINANTYQWIFPGGTPSTSTDEEPASICYLTPGVYDVTLIATNINGSDTLTLPNYITVWPYSPSQSILQSGDTLFSNTGFVTYQWFYDGDTIPGATNYFYVATQSGDFSVVCIDNNGCSVEAVILNVVASIPSSADNKQPILVYPNPVDDKLTIHNAQFTIEAADAISIYNLMGQGMKTVQLQTTSYELQTLDVSHLPSGIYYIEITSGEKVLRAKFVKR